MKKNCDFKSVTLLASALLVPLSTLAANQTKSGAINLLSTFECISVRAAFSGDDNANNSATIRFRKRGTGSWLNAYPPFVDRRATLPDGASNDYANQARGSIVGLTPDTAYDVLISWSDPDGSSGSSSITNTISTLSLVPPANGKKLWVDALVSSEGDGTPDSPYQTIATALQGAKPGDTINVRAGSYAPFVWSKSGNATNYIVLKSVAGTNAVILGGAIDYNIRVKANYIH